MEWLIWAGAPLVLLACFLVSHIDDPDPEPQMQSVPQHRMPFWLKALLWIGGAFVGIGALVQVFVGDAWGQDIRLATPEENAWLQTWIPPACCVTANCCFKVKAADVTPLPADRWQIVATGQVVGRKDYSQDGNYWRCACDHIGGVWQVSLLSKTHCLFTPMQTTERQ